MSDIEEFHDERPVGKIYDAALFGRLLGYVRPYRGMAAGAVTLLLLASLLSLLGPLLTAVALDLFVMTPAGDEEPNRAARLAGALLEAGGWELAPAEGVLLLGAVYFFRVLERAYLMQPEDGPPPKHELEAPMLIPIVALAALVLLLGVFNQSVVTSLVLPGLPS